VLARGGVEGARLPAIAHDVNSMPDGYVRTTWTTVLFCGTLSLRFLTAAFRYCAGRTRKVPPSIDVRRDICCSTNGRVASKIYNILTYSCALTFACKLLIAVGRHRFGSRGKFRSIMREHKPAGQNVMKKQRKTTVDHRRRGRAGCRCSSPAWQPTLVQSCCRRHDLAHSLSGASIGKIMKRTR
jgi:hypothetical protein